MRTAPQPTQLFIEAIDYIIVVVTAVIQNWIPWLLVYGDMGKHGGAESLGALVSEVEAGDTHAILHIGDFAYDFDSDGGVVRMC